MAGSWQSISLISLSFSTPHSHLQHSSRKHITRLYASLSPYQYLPALLQGYHAPQSPSSFSPAKSPFDQYQDLNQMSGGKQLDQTNSHSKLLLSLAFSLLLLLNPALNCSVPLDPFLPQADVAQAERRSPQIKQLLSYISCLPARCVDCQHTHVQSSLFLCKYLLSPRYGKHSLLSALENIMHNSFQYSFIHLEVCR